MTNPIEGKFDIKVDNKAVLAAVANLKYKAEARAKSDKELLKKCLSLIDLTTLNSTDSIERGELFAERVNGLIKSFPQLPNVAAICVYPSLVSAVKQTLTAKDVKIASVAAGFPASQTFIDIKLSECLMCLEMGADELDVVMSLGYFLEGDYFTVFSELQQIKEVAGDARVKVILETGALPSMEEIRLASFLAMEAGADFIKTSTGKIDVAATPEALYVMCQAAKEYYEATGRMVGIKPAGGMVNSFDAVYFYSIVEAVLGEKWLNNKWLRLGASRLADNLLSDIIGEDIKYFSASTAGVKY
ncbi:MAG: deoxyribose-phosphate aldolase [Bacteroidales bacterium]|jgi:deoxyribose-phosphate aldolase|nr:deoxyribose-phosphate aldolase [Bacteroidales bacterium]MDD4384683.1 deoxyribose-phosphate aldolase [Bacteroidales bacterium]MDY0197062.1 deoxyribose-phosphate aldolase [Tenuifilaceae bacterium]